MRQEKWRFYIKPFDVDGARGDWIEVTDDVIADSLGKITQDLDNVDFDVGIFRVSSVNVRLRNDHGKYSDINVEQSIFRYKRSESLLKITYAIESDAPLCGVALLGDAYLDDDDEHEIFTGLLNDESLAMDIDAQIVAFTVLGRESVLDRMKVPYGSISNGDLISEVIFTCLNDSRVTELLTLDIANITVASDVAIDDVSKFQNRTVKTAFSDLLVAGNSVLYIKDGAIYVKPRTAGVAVASSFYGQASTQGAENIQTIKAVKNGLSRMFNFWTWTDTSLSSEESSSSDKFGIRDKSLAYDWLTDNTSRQTVLDNLKNEFGNPKIELDLYAQFSIPFFELNLLDRVTIDYPTVYFTGENPMPICGVAICGEAILPRAQWSFTIDETTPFKIIGREIDMKSSLIKFKLREI